MDFWAGWCGGVAGVLVSHPFDVMRTRQAVSTLSLSATAREMLKEPGGLRSVYRGIYSPCLTVGCWKCVALGVYRWCLPDRGGIDPAMFDVVTSSMIAGTASALTIGPAETIKLRTMNQRMIPEGKGAGKGSTSLMKLELQQAASLTSGDVFRATRFLCLRDSYGTIFFLGPYEYIKRAVQRRQPQGASPLVPALVAGAISGPIGWLSVYPLEVYRINVMDAASPVQGDSVLDVARKIQQRAGGGLAGLRVWFRGFPGCAIRSSLQMPVTMAVFESICEYFK